MIAFTRTREAGFLLIEVMVAVVVLAIGLLGVSALQIGIQKSNHSALQRSKATMLGYYMMDAMRANKGAALLGSYNLLIGIDTPVCTVPSAGNLIANDLRTWLLTLKSDLGDVSTTCGLIQCNTTTCTVRVYWDDSRAVGGATSQAIAITSRL